MRGQFISTSLAVIAAITSGSLVSFNKDTQQQQRPTEALPTQVVSFDEAKDSEETKQQLAKLTDQMATLGNAVTKLITDKTDEAEGLRGAANQQSQQYESMKGQLSEAVEIVKGLKGVNQEQFGQVRSVVNSVGARVKKLEGNAENFDSLLERVKSLEQEVRVLKTKSIVEKPTETSNGSTTVENVVQGPIYYPAVQGTSSGGSSGSRIVNSGYQTIPYYPPMASQPLPIYQAPIPQQIVQETWQPASTTSQKTCKTRVWDRRTRSWVCVN
jgi:hypothetical protein